MESTVDSSHWIPAKSSPFDRDSTRCDGLRQRFATLHPGGDREFNQWLHGGVRKVMEVSKNGYHGYNLDGFCRGNFHLEMNDLGIAPLMYRGTQKISNRNMFPGWLFDDIYLILRGFQLFCSGGCYSPTGLLQMVEYHTEPIEHSSKKNMYCSYPFVGTGYTMLFIIMTIPKIGWSYHFSSLWLSLCYSKL